MDKSTHTSEYLAAIKEVAKLRKSAGLTQRVLASRLGVSASWVAKVETGERRLDILEFYRVCVCCGRDPSSVAKKLFRQFGVARPGNGN